MSFELYEDRGTEPEGYSAELQFVGNAAASPTSKPYGKGMTVTWVSTGLYTITFADPPGNFLGMHGYSFLDATPANAAGWTAVVKSYTAASGSTKATIQFSVYNSTFALANLAATTTFSCDLKFKRGYSGL
jgi:hypothetical protein